MTVKVEVVDIEKLWKVPVQTMAKAVYQAAVDFDFPVALWRMPQQDSIYILVSFDKNQPRVKPDLEELPPGFLLSPFENETAQTIFLKADLLINITDKKLEVDEKLSNDSFASFIKAVYKGIKTNTKPAYHLPSLTGKLKEEGKPQYLKYVADTIQAIKNGEFHKAVPARLKKIDIADNFDIIETFRSLCKSYDGAFVSLVSIPKIGTWVGATPEVLISVDRHKVFKTVALAATQKREVGKPLSETAWTQKEIEEQAMVSRYIINCFKKIRLREFEEKGPKTVAAGNLLHLKTSYEVDMEATNFPQLGTVMLDLLHPTSAVAGMPKTAAHAFIKSHESFDREFFSGYLGPVNVGGKTNLFVNLRCMQLFRQKAILYAGAGVTEDSDPEKEWQETVMKFNTLLNILNDTN